MRTAVATICAVAACDASPPGATPTTRDTISTPRATTSTARAATATPRDATDTAQVQPDTLQLGIDGPRRVDRGEAVTLVLTARNVSGRALDLYLRGREPTALITISDVAGAVVWRNLGTGVPAILLLRTLEPGDTLTIAEQWQPAADVAPGTYTIHAELLGELRGFPYPRHIVEIGR